ncbi:MAG: hypothetical protein HW386_1496 [Gammaproteobacteria bacterium]|nr:hypothetical protein [Gammaproteobacteria bacterium]
MNKLKRILVPTDFSDTADLALRYGHSLARQYEAQLHLLHVIPDPTTAMGIYEQIADAIPPDWQETMLRHSEEQLQKQAAGVCGPANKVIRTTLQGDAYSEIIRYTKFNAIDLIVIGTHGRTSSVHHLIGGLTDRIFRKAPCPVLTVPPADRRFKLP